MVNKEFWQGKKVLITGHTGFKGAWLSLWLRLWDAEVSGFSLSPPTVPSLFELANLKDVMCSIEGDIRDADLVKEVVRTQQPEIVIHLAAQSLVRRSYADPVETYSTNTMGTVNLLEAIRKIGGVRVVVIISSDKCYDNRDWVWGYREIDSMGGFDPYSSSKGASELITAAYRHSFFNPQTFDQHGVALASARAGNVIAGGDWAEDRLVPDIMKAFLEDQVLKIRNPDSRRPWQHVLEPLNGYLILAENLYNHGVEFAEAWNFGPNNDALRKVSWVVERIGEMWGQGGRWELARGTQPHEARFLSLDCSKAKMRLGWRPQLDLEQALRLTVDWYKGWQNDPATVREITEAQIISYTKLQNG